MEWTRLEVNDPVPSLRMYISQRWTAELWCCVWMLKYVIPSDETLKRKIVRPSDVVLPAALSPPQTDFDSHTAHVSTHFLFLSPTFKPTRCLPPSYKHTHTHTWRTRITAQCPTLGGVPITMAFPSTDNALCPTKEALIQALGPCLALSGPLDPRKTP